ncbi:hypothetical protein B0H11DRAFT_2189700 [Mycena galericulata]|nr:hypothetical protein B0H11DRAFT_2189700 [Mycena galericulata]
MYVFLPSTSQQCWPKQADFTPTTTLDPVFLLWYSRQRHVVLHVPNAPTGENQVQNHVLGLSVDPAVVLRMFSWDWATTELKFDDTGFEPRRERVEAAIVGAAIGVRASPQPIRTSTMRCPLSVRKRTRELASVQNLPAPPALAHIALNSETLDAGEGESSLAEAWKRCEGAEEECERGIDQECRSDAARVARGQYAMPSTSNSDPNAGGGHGSRGRHSLMAA